MSLPPWMNKRKSSAPAPDYSAKHDTHAYLAGTKKTPDEAGYRLGQPNDAKKRCHECKYYEHPGQAESSCDKVVGVVRAEGMCDLFAQRDYHDGDKPATPAVTIQIHSSH